MKPTLWTDTIRKLVSTATSLAASKNHSTCNDIHILYILLTEYPIAKTLLTAPIVSLCTEGLTSSLTSMPSTGGAVMFGIKAKELMEVAEQQMLLLKDRRVMLEHVLLAALHTKLLSGNNVPSHDTFLEMLKNLRGTKNVQESATQQNITLGKYTRDLTALARDNKLKVVVGRNAEIRNCITILSRMGKNNPVLIGEPGVGKTAIVEGIAQRIVAGDVPNNLKNKQIMALDLGAMIAGTKLRGEFEERMNSLVKEISSSNGQIILFIDELHTLVGTGGDGASGAAQLLKPALARGEIRCLGATTIDEYRKHIEKDKALDRRFQAIKVDEPTVDEAVAIIRGLKSYLEAHHGIKISDAAIVSAVSLSKRYITSKKLPDKAIDLIDEAAARLKLELDSMPGPIDDCSREISILKSQLQSLEAVGETDANLVRLLTEKQEEFTSASLNWHNEKDVVTSIVKTLRELESLRSLAENKQSTGDLDEVSRLLYTEIPKLENTLTELRQKLAELHKVSTYLRAEVEVADVSRSISSMTGIPVSKIGGDEATRLINMEAELGTRVIGQTKPLSFIASAIRRSRTGLQDPNRPIGSFIFLGPTGVGKTELAKSLADFLFDDAASMIRFDMSEYMEKASVSRLIGSPPGYVGYDEGGQLTEAVRRKPYSVVLFDEIEKAHPDVFNILLQVLDDGRLTDSQGRVIDFKNVIIILTSNIGSSIIMETDDVEADDVQEKIEAIMLQKFRPEFLNRVDARICFKKLSFDDVKKIAEIQLSALVKRMDAQNIALTFTQKVKDFICEAGYDPAFGARPLRRAIQNHLVDPLASKLLEMSEVTQITVDLNDANEIILS